MTFARKDMPAYVISRSIKDPNDIRILQKIPNNDLRRFKVMHKGVLNTSLLSSIASRIQDNSQDDRVISVACIADEGYKVTINAESNVLDSNVEEIEDTPEEVSQPPVVTEVEVTDEIPDDGKVEDENEEDLDLPDFDDDEDLTI